MYLVKTPVIVKWLYPSLVWNIPTNDKVIYLTFDDGPDPGITPGVLSLLNKFDTKATFFCVGERVKKNNRLFQEVINEGHVAGNHSFHHLKGRKVSLKDYINDVRKAKEFIPSVLFRPPYGSITRKQIHALKGEYKLVMWDVLTGDFDKKLTKEDVLRNSVKNTIGGSIVVFHDNVKFKDKTMYALKGFIDHFSERGYNFKPLPVDDL